MASVAEAAAVVGCACGVASTVTVWPAVVAAGAVYGMARPFGQAGTVVAVTAGTAGIKEVVAVAGISGTAATVVKKPQTRGLLQTDQSTPAFVASLLTAAVRLTVVDPVTCEGAEGTKPMDSVVEGVIVIGVELTVVEGNDTD